MEIEVVYGLAEQQKLYVLNVEPPISAREAVLRSPLAQDFPDVDVHHAPLGVFGKVVKDNALLHEYDRVEVYRPLLVNPKDARRLRAAKKKKAKHEYPFDCGFG